MSTPAPVLATSPLPDNPAAPPNVVDRVSAFVKRFVFLKDPSLYRLLALWIIHTYVVDEFEYTGYIFAHSPEPESGKTRLLEVLEVLIENSSGILVSPSGRRPIPNGAGTHSVPRRSRYVDQQGSAKKCIECGLPT
jgi:hypothetical protein